MVYAGSRHFILATGRTQFQASMNDFPKKDTASHVYKCRFPHPPRPRQARDACPAPSTPKCYQEVYEGRRSRFSNDCGPSPAIRYDTGVKRCSSSKQAPPHSTGVAREPTKWDKELQDYADLIMGLIGALRSGQLSWADCAELEEKAGAELEDKLKAASWRKI